LTGAPARSRPFAKRFRTKLDWYYSATARIAEKAADLIRQER
jgi:hypothetical protein